MTKSDFDEVSEKALNLFEYGQVIALLAFVDDYLFIVGQALDCTMYVTIKEIKLMQNFNACHAECDKVFILGLLIDQLGSAMNLIFQTSQFDDSSVWLWNMV